MNLNNALKYGLLSVFSLLLNSSIGLANSGSCFFSSYGDNGDEGIDCSSLTGVIAGISWEVKGLPDTHQAGERIQFDVVLHKNKYLSKEWPASIFFIKLQIGEAFFLKILATEELKQFFYSEQEMKIFHIDEIVNKNIGGKALLQLHLSVARFYPFQSCDSDLDLASIQINSEHVDLDPPAVIGIRYSQESYQPGEKVTAFIEFSEKVKGLVTNHITFKNERDDFPEYSRIGFQLHRTTKDGYEYAVEFDLKEQVLPGEYFLCTFNRQDVFGNFVSDVKAENLPPLVVRSDSLDS